MPTIAARRWSGAAAIGILVVTFGGVGGGLVLGAQSATPPLRWLDALLTLSFLSLPAVGALLIWRRPGNAVGWLLGAPGVFAGIYAVALGWATYALRVRPGAVAGGAVAAWVTTWALVAGFGPLPFVAATFPDGRIERGWLRRFGGLTVVALLALGGAQSLMPGAIDGVDSKFKPIPNPIGARSLEGLLSVVSAVSVVVVIGFTVAVIADAVMRYRRATGDERRQLRAVAAFPGLIPGGIALSFVLPRAVVDGEIRLTQIVALFGVSATIAVGVLRYHLYDLGQYVRRTAAYVALSGAVVVAVLATAGVIGVLTPSNAVVPAAVTAAAATLALGPLRARVQRGVDRLLFGRRSEPYAVLAEVGAGLEASVSPTAALQATVDTLASSLRVPYVGVEVASDGATDGARVRNGEPVAYASRFTLVHQHQTLGTLVVGQRSSDEAFNDRELKLLGDLARQVAVAVHSVTVNEALQRARFELVQSREEERRRLRRDIHDGIGPTLAGTMLQLDTLRDVIAGEGSEAQMLVAKVKDNLRAVVDDVRRVSHDLRPPALDELGLSGALRERVESLTTGSGLEVELDLHAPRDGLAAAVEVAVYRITSEALTNVVRHAKARRCGVRLSVGDRIELEVVDDGIGVPDGSTAGVGLVSMRERAAELGGECTIEPVSPSGTRVCARLPTGALTR